MLALLIACGGDDDGGEAPERCGIGIYFNRDGGTFRQAMTEDALTNRTGRAVGETVIPPADIDDASAIGTAPIICDRGLDGIAFLVWNEPPLDPERACALTANYAGHLLGLDSVIGAPDDVMSFEDPAPAAYDDKVFLDQLAECGGALNDEPGCVCGGTFQNAYQTLLEDFGPACE